MVKFVRHGKWSREYIAREYKILIYIAYITNIIMLITFEYCDVDSLTAWSLNFWDLLLGEGNLREFYEYTQVNIHGAAHANCEGNYLWLLPICIWNLPLWLAHKVTGTMLVTNFYSICWMKMFFLVMLILCAIGISKLCYYFTKNIESAVLAYILMMLSPEILMSTGYAGQDEIVYICTLVWAVWFWVNEDYLKCYFFMLITVSSCPIMLIPALIMILMKQKKLLYIARDMFGLLCPTILFEFLYRNDEIYQYIKVKHGASELGTSMLNSITISLPEGEISIGIGVLIIIFFWLYVMDNEENTKKIFLFFISLSMVVICFLMPNNFYRIFLWVPFIIILIMCSQANRNVNLFFLTVISYCRTYYALTLNYPQNMNMYYIMKNSWITSLHDKYGLYDYLNLARGSLGKYFLEGEYIPLLNTLSATVAYIGICMLLFINYPKEKERKFGLEIPYKVSVYIYCGCMPLIVVAFFKMLF